MSLLTILVNFCLCFFLMTKLALAGSLTDGVNAYVVGKYDVAFKKFAPLADRGNDEAQTYLGRMYVTGQGVLQDYKNALKWFSLAADQGNAIAQQKLGVMYEHGQGVEQNYMVALKWYRLSAEQGNASAQRNLVVMYNEGLGVPQDDIEALMWENISETTAALADSENMTEAIDQPNSIAIYMNNKQIFKARRLTSMCLESNLRAC